MQEVEANGLVTISIIDNGIGVAPEYESEIFRRGFRLPEAVALDSSRRYNGRGQGLGLSIVQRIVDFLNGKIRAIGEPGVGTRFEVSISQGF